MHHNALTVQKNIASISVQYRDGQVVRAEVDKDKEKVDNDIHYIRTWRKDTYQDYQ